jgi:hypothetical protein
MLKTIVGMFEDPADARRAVHGLEQEGFPLDAASVVMRERQEDIFPSMGSLLGQGVAPNLATTTPMDRGEAPAAKWVDPNSDVAGYGTVVAAGALARAIGGAGVGVAAGGLAGALSDVGIPNDLARDLVDRVRAGRETLVCIRVEPGAAEKVEQLFVDNGAAVVYRGASKTTAYVEGERAAAGAQRGL